MKPRVWKPDRLQARYGQALDPERCAAPVYNGDFHSSQCSRKGVIEEHGHKWCRQHAPSLVEERDRKQQEKRDKARTAQKEEWRKNKRRREMPLETLRAIAEGHNDPRSLALEALGKLETGDL